MKPTAAFIFLNAIPYVDIETLSSLDESCAICTAPYFDGPCQIRDPLDTPVKIRCGHIYGHNCLVRWMLSETFDNQCAFCRAQIVDESDQLKSPDPIVVAQLMYFENIVLDEMEGKNIRKQELLELFDRYRTKIRDVGSTPSEMLNRDRVVMIWEEFVDMVRRKYEEDDEEFRLREGRLERDHRDVAEAAVRLEQPQEMNHEWSGMRFRNSIMVGVAGVAGLVIASRLW